MPEPDDKPAEVLKLGGMLYAITAQEGLRPQNGVFLIPEHKLFELLCKAFEAGQKSK